MSNTPHEPMAYAFEVDQVMNKLYDEIGSRKWDANTRFGFWQTLREAVDRQIESEKQEVEYICVDDYQGTGFHIGDTQTAEEWKEWALSMNEIEESENYDTFAKLDPVEAVDYIADMWQIEIVVFDPTNPDHVELRKAYEEEF